MNIIVNGRFRCHRISGVQRYAHELTKRLDLQVCEPSRALKGPVGHLWEQTVLPWNAASHLIWSPCATGPVFARKHVVTIHDLFTIDSPEWFKANFAVAYRVMLTKLAKTASHLIAVSEYTKTRLVDRLRIDPARITVIHNGVDDCFRKASSLPKTDETAALLGLPSPNYLLSVSSLEPRKNIARLLLAWKQALPELPRDLWLVLAGNEDRRVFGDLGIDDFPARVHCTGYVSDQHLPVLYAGATGFVYPSLAEGFGLPPLEAMAAGTPVLTSSKTSLPEVCGTAALYCDPLDVGDIAARLKDLACDASLRLRLQEKGLHRAAGFTWDRSASATMAVLEAAALGVPAAAPPHAPPSTSIVKSPAQAATGLSSLKVAIVHEWLTTYAGSEKVVEQLLLLYPQADLYSLVDHLPAGQREFLQGRPVHTSFLQRLPFSAKVFRKLLWLLPVAVENFNLSGYDLVLTSSHAVAKGVITGPDQLHICYCHSPIRYAWDLQHEYLQQSGLDRGWKSLYARAVLHYIRTWDVRTSNSVDHFIANSAFIARRIAKLYRRDAVVIHPPVAVDSFTRSTTKEDYYVTASRLAPYKRVDLIIKAFAKMPNRTLKVVGTGPELARCKASAGGAKNVQFLGYLPHDALNECVGRAKAFVFAAEEDFGISVVEAQACGTPVICYGRGGVLDTVVPGENGTLFLSQTPESIIEAVNRFELTERYFSPARIRTATQRFHPERFRQQIANFVSESWKQHLEKANGVALPQEPKRAADSLAATA